MGCTETELLPGQILCQRHRKQDGRVLLIVGPAVLAVAIGMYAAFGEGILPAVLIMGGLAVLNIGMGIMRLADNYHSERAARRDKDL